eukprot:13981-Heterococcus_DN1.PRE.3
MTALALRKWRCTISSLKGRLSLCLCLSALSAWTCERVQRRSSQCRTCIAALEHELRKPVNELQPAEAIQMLKSFMRVDKSLEEEPFYAVVRAAIGS